MHYINILYHKTLGKVNKNVCTRADSGVEVWWKARVLRIYKSDDIWYNYFIM